jgi:hypothetical protein
VGPASYMHDSLLGKEIDSYDLIVRINRSIESVSRYSLEIGSRTDILYSCLIEKPENAGKINVDEFVSQYSLKYVCAPPKSSIEGISRGNSLSELISTKKLEEIKEKIPFRIIDFNLNNKIANIVKCRPNTGFLAIYDILFHKPKKLGIYGFSFYLDGFVDGTKSGIDISEKQFVSKCFNSKRHKQENLWNYAKNTLLKNEMIYLDPYLKFILEMDELNKERFSIECNRIKLKNNA